MPQIRLHLTGTRPRSTTLFSALETAFEDDGLPLALVEIDEAAGTEEISVYAEEDDADAVEARIRAAAGADGPSLAISREALPDIDWVAKSLEGLKPVRAGGFVVHGAHDREELEPGEIAIEIEAGLAFGTGHHGTTAGCLETLARLVPKKKPANALDLGTGSAVLAIAIARLAPIPVLATDIDPVAVAVAAENVALNGVSAHVTTAAADGFDDPVFSDHGPFALIVANILAGPLIGLAPQMRRHLAPAGALVLSGILERQHDAVVEAYAAEGFRRVDTLRREGWVTIHLE
ncbi:MAG: 50S ribosomal protein L11 methyltransferase [Aquamicrobium sp.]|uniref:50S ribosomal protein L11 methyltransferase n=1 Tax=Aquamicrobium sp. TaxID=1872579 RepID=UPI00349E9F0A|nr:50S ribosomal protein L11 methyltransferase [Aquamicrobium sp.]